MVTTTGYVGIIIGLIIASAPAGMGAEIGKRLITPFIDKWNEHKNKLGDLINKREEWQPN